VSKNEDWRLIFHGALIEQYYRQLSEDQDGHAMMMRMSGPPTGQYVAIVEATYWGKSRILLDALREIYLEPVE
jgi:hypothetical protein